MAFLGWFTKSDWGNICLKINNKFVDQIALGGSLWQRSLVLAGSIRLLELALDHILETTMANCVKHVLYRGFWSRLAFSLARLFLLYIIIDVSGSSMGLGKLIRSGSIK